MFFRAKCPIHLEEKTWVEYRMHWLANVLGAEKLKNVKMLDSDEDFDIEYEATPEGVELLRQFIGDQMEIDCDHCRVEVVEAEQLEGISTRYVGGDDPVIFVPDSDLEEPYHLIALLAHQLAKHHLIESGNLAGDEGDLEGVAHLATLYFGYGLFSANSTFYDSYSFIELHEAWQIGKRGALSSQVVGYALALLAMIQNNQKPEWRNELRQDAFDSLVKGIKFLNKTEDSIFEPEKPILDQWTLEECIYRLGTKSDTNQLAALWQLKDTLDEELDARVVEPVIQCLRSNEVAIRRQAASLIGYAAVSNRVFEQIDRCIGDNDAEVRGHLARAVGLQCVDKKEAQGILINMISDSEDKVVVGAGMSLATLGEADEDVINPLLKRLRVACVAQNEELSSQLMQILLHLHQGDFEQLLDDTYSEDEEIHFQIKSLYEELQNERSGNEEEE